MQIRRSKPDEGDSVKALVQTVADEIYGGAWASPPLPIGDADWSLSWVAVSGNALVRGEAEIAGRGH